MNSRCVLAWCCSGPWSSFTHLADFLWLKRMPWRSRLTHYSPGRTSSPSVLIHSSKRPLIVTSLRHRTSDTRRNVLAQPCHVGSAALRRSGSPSAPVKTTLGTCYVSNMRKESMDKQWRNDKTDQSIPHSGKQHNHLRRDAWHTRI